MAVADESIRVTIAGLLADEGYAVESLVPHPAAAAEIAHLRPHALVLEVGPRGENLPLLDALRSLPETQGTTVVTLNANDLYLKLAEAFSRALPMPFDIGELLQALA